MSTVHVANKCRARVSSPNNTAFLNQIASKNVLFPANKVCGLNLCGVIHYEADAIPSYLPRYIGDIFGLNFASRYIWTNAQAIFIIARDKIVYQGEQINAQFRTYITSFFFFVSNLVDYVGSHLAKEECLANYHIYDVMQIIFIIKLFCLNKVKLFYFFQIEFLLQKGPLLCFSKDKHTSSKL